MAKKDFVIKEDIERGKKDEQATPESDKKTSTALTEVKNANASGLGSMGRNDQEQENIEQGIRNIESRREGKSETNK